MALHRHSCTGVVAALVRFLYYYYYYYYPAVRDGRIYHYTFPQREFWVNFGT